MIPLPEKPMLTAHADINDNIIKTYKYLKQLAEDLNISLPAYSETPQRIGTWIDGTPVWRKAFTVRLADMFDNASDFEAMLGDGYIDMRTEIEPQKNPLNKSFLLGFHSIFMLGVIPCGADDVPLKLVDGSMWDSFGITLPEMVIGRLTDVGYDGLTNEGIYGYIDFATPENNIKTGDDDV